MAISEKEAVASLRALVCMAKADGVLQDQELRALQGALEGVALPGGVTLGSLLAEAVDFDEQLASLTTPELKEQLFKSAYSMAHADGSCSPVEQALLDKMSASLSIPTEQRSLLARLFTETKRTVLPSSIEAVTDPEARAIEIHNDVVKYAILSGILGANPIPGLAIASDLAVVALQVKLVRDIGQYWGHTVDKKAALSLLGGVGIGTGARLAVSQLAKLVPGWGSAFGAATSFASTFALGRVADEFFSSSNAASMESLKDRFKEAEAEGKEVYRHSLAAISAKEMVSKPKLEALNEELKAGTITQDEYEERAASL